MATLEKPTLRMQPHDEAIFVAGDSRRARRLGRAVALTSFLAVLWVVGLGIGMVGFDSLPGVPFVKGSHARSPVAPVAEVPAAARDTARALLAAKSADAAVSGPQAASVAAQRAAAARRRAARKVARAAAATRVVAPPAAAVNPAQRERGWSRKGNATPPGQVRRAQPPPAPPATSQGRRVGQATTPPAPLVPPGQAKKRSTQLRHLRRRRRADP
jgi:hypothetical protein